MKNKYIIRPEEYEYFIKTLESGSAFDDNDYEVLNNNIRSANDFWDVEISSNNYFFCRVIDRLDKQKLFDSKVAIENYYALTDRMHFEIQECDNNFVDELMNFLPDKDLTFDENIFEFIKAKPNV